MPPNERSRYKFSLGRTDAEGRRYLTPRKKFLFVDLPDNRPHRVTEGETLEFLAFKYLGGLVANSSVLWWIIADFQPEPIFDPTIVLSPGVEIVIPSRNTARFVLSERRRSR